MYSLPKNEKFKEKSKIHFGFIIIYGIVSVVVLIFSVIGVQIENLGIVPENTGIIAHIDENGTTNTQAEGGTVQLRNLLFSDTAHATSVLQPLPAYDGYMTYLYTDQYGHQMTYYIYAPGNQVPGKKYPVVLLLHGSGEKADPQASPLQNQATLLQQFYANTWSSTAVQSQYPGYIVIPQIEAPDRWVSVPGNTGSYQMAEKPSDSLLLVKEIMDTVQQQHSNIDANRIYLTGLSMGAYGAWEAGERWPNYFAADAPLAGAGDPSHASTLLTMSVWAFYGAKDTTVPTTGTKDMIQAISADGGSPKLTVYPDLAHGIWDRTYSMSEDPTFFAWLFSQSKKVE
jgi:predicted peptidase